MLTNYPLDVRSGHYDILRGMEVATPPYAPAAAPGADAHPQTVSPHDRHKRKAINVALYDWTEARKMKQGGESWSQFFSRLLWFYIGAQGVAHDTPKRPALPP